MRDAIVLSSWGWETFNSPERVCLALASLGVRVLHVEPPVSVFRATKSRPLRELQKNIYGMQLTFLSSRTMNLPFVRDVQATAMRRQISRAARELNLHDPILLHCWPSNLFLLCAQMSRTHYSVHLCIDDVGVDTIYERCLDASDLSLVIPKSVFHKLRAKYGEKVKLMLQPVDTVCLAPSNADAAAEPAELTSIPSPRLGDLGPPSGGSIGPCSRRC